MLSPISDAPVTFAAAHAEWQRLAKAEQAIKDDDDAVDAAATLTDAAFKRMMALPAENPAQAAAKLAAYAAHCPAEWLLPYPGAINLAITDACRFLAAAQLRGDGA